MKQTKKDALQKCDGVVKGEQCRRRVRGWHDAVRCSTSFSSLLGNLCRVCCMLDWTHLFSRLGLPLPVPERAGMHEAVHFRRGNDREAEGVSQGEAIGGGGIDAMRARAGRTLKKKGLLPACSPSHSAAHIELSTARTHVQDGAAYPATRLHSVTCIPPLCIPMLLPDKLLFRSNVAFRPPANDWQGG